MKKFAVTSAICFLLTLSLFGQGFADSNAAQRHTALRCAQAARNYISDENYTGALSQSEVGLSYNDTLSDLWYAKAFASYQLGQERAVALECARQAYEYNDWNVFSEVQGAILYATVLLETDDPELAFKILGDSFSCEIEFLRARACYAMGDVAKARNIIASASKVFAEDERFPLLFFKNEFFITVFNDKKIDNGAYEMAASFIQHIQNWKDSCPEILFYASFFVTDENESSRLFKQFLSEFDIIPEAIYYGVKKDFVPENNALSMLQTFADNEIEYRIFVKTLSCFTDPAVIEMAENYLVNYTGTVLYDRNLDLIPDFSVQYQSGRPFMIFADQNQDEVSDFVLNCDFGVPYEAFISDEEVEIAFDIYPVIKTITFSQATTFELIQNSFEWDCVKFSEVEVLPLFKFFFAFPQDNTVPAIGKNDFSTFMNKSRFISSSIQKDFDVYEKKYLIANGTPVEIEYNKNGVMYAKGFFSDGNLSYRTIDKDFDGVFELTEYYQFDEKGYLNFISIEEENNLYEELFGSLYALPGLYLKKVALDKDCDGEIDCTEEYVLNGKIVSWLDKGKVVCSYSKIQNHSESYTEVTTFVSPVNSDVIKIKFENSVPVEIYDNDEVSKVVLDRNNGIYYIGELPDEKICAFVASKAARMSEMVDRTIEDFDDGRVVLIKISDRFFAQYYK